MAGRKDLLCCGSLWGAGTQVQGEFTQCLQNQPRENAVCGEAVERLRIHKEKHFLLLGEARLNDEVAPHQRLVFITTSSCRSMRQAAPGEGRMAEAEQRSGK